VTVATPLIKPIVDWDDYIGRFEARQSVEVRPRVSGYVARIAFRDGEFARAGDLLYVIDSRPYDAALAQARAESARARATADLAHRNLARSVTLFKQNAISREELIPAAPPLPRLMPRWRRRMRALRRARSMFRSRG